MVTMVMRKSQKWYFCQKNPCSYRSKTWYAYITSLREKYGWIPLGHTSSFTSVRPKIPKMVFQQKIEPREFDP